MAYLHVVRVMRHGVETTESPEMDAARREFCLCLHCGNLKPNDPKNCVMAETMFALCKTKGMAMGISRCEDFVQVIT